MYAQTRHREKSYMPGPREQRQLGKNQGREKSSHRKSKDAPALQKNRKIVRLRLVPKRKEDGRRVTDSCDIT